MNLPQWFYTVAWIGWGLLFVLIEAIAIVDDDRNDTLSEYIWRMLSISHLFWFLLAGFMVWLTLHFLSGKV